MQGTGRRAGPGRALLPRSVSHIVSHITVPIKDLSRTFREWKCAVPAIQYSCIPCIVPDIFCEISNEINGEI